MFRNARIKLTSWYLIIIMLISISFSTVIYRIISIELERFTHMQRTRQSFQPFPPPDLELIAETKHRIIFMLFMINGTIVIVAGGLGYFLAGKTLKPIAEMVDEQHRFISDASHELKTPLTALKTSMEVGLRDKKMTVLIAKQLLKENIEDINSLQELSERLLTLSQYESHATLLMTHVDIFSSIEKAIHAVNPIATKKHMTIQQTGNHHAILGYPEQLTNLFIILLDNAIKYSKRNATIEIAVNSHDGLVGIRVIDHGVGIPKKDIPHIFDRFFRGDEARSKTTSHGYGLGLAIAKKIVGVHHGYITVTSTLGKGSTFQVTFRKV